MTDRHKTRARPTARRAFGRTYGQVLSEGASRRTVLKGLLAGTALAAGGASPAWRRRRSRRSPSRS